MTENEIAKFVVDASFKIHSNLGPGFRADLVVARKVIVEVKSVEMLAPSIISKC